MKLEKAIELITNFSKEDADKSLKDFEKRDIRTSIGKQTYFRSKRLVLNKPGSVKTYITTGLKMDMNSSKFSEEETVKFDELKIRHSNLFNFIELVKSGEENLEELFSSVVDFCPEGKEIKRRKNIAYQFLQENKIQEIGTKTYFTRSKYTDKILKGIDIPEHQLVQILLDYQTYLSNTEWRKYIKTKEEEERRKNTKRTFTQWLQITKTL
jgi:hypothetical protein